MSRKADVDGVYPEMTVGMTRDMLGVGEGDEGEFLFRPTDGDGSIKDGFASIERIEGNSVVWNQSCKVFLEAVSKPYHDFVENNKGVSITNWRAYNPFTLPANLLSKLNHKCLLLFSYTNATTQSPSIDVEVAGTDETRYVFSQNEENVAKFFTVANSSQTDNINVFCVTAQTGVTVSNLLLYDLTQMFGAGNEPTTIEEFYSRIPKGIDINAYNEGEVVNMNVEGIKSVGFNAWDEEWENGSFNTTTGVNINDEYVDSIQIRGKNSIPIVSNASYYVTVPSSGIWIIFYDKDGQVITDVKNPLGSTDGNSINTKNNFTFLTPINATSMKFYAEGSYGPTYKNDICINLVHTGYRNGEYEPYVSDEIALPIADYFPNGMNSIGDVKDELTASEAIQRIGVVDMGTLEWKEGYSDLLGNQTAYYVTLDDSSFNENNILTSRYSIIPVGSTTKGIIKFTDRSLVVADSSYTDAASFKAAMSGVMLYYELAEPIVTTFDKPLDLDYQVWDFGTEEAIAEGKTTPLKASIIYEFNARDTIRANKLALKNKADKTYVDNAIAQAIISTINANY